MRRPKPAEWFRNTFGKPTADEFGRIMGHALERIGASEICYDPESFKLTFLLSSGVSAELNLHNVYPVFHAARPWERNRCLERFLAPYEKEFLQPSTWNAAAPGIRPALRDAFLFEGGRLQGRLSGHGHVDIASRTFTDRLCVSLVEDRPEHMCLVPASALSQWGVSFDEALARALLNLSAVTEPRWTSPFPGVHVSAWRDDYDATRLLLDGILADLPVRGAPVALVPNRNCLIVTGADDVEALAQSLALAEAGLNETAPMSALPLRQTASGWVPWELSKDHPCYPAWRRIWNVEFDQLYSQQQELLKSIYIKENLDIFVASFLLDEQDTGAIRSVCSWARDVLAELPKTDVIGFVDTERPEGKQILGYFDWSRVESCCGDLLQRTTDIPERYRVENFPTEEQFRQMAMVST